RRNSIPESGRRRCSFHQLDAILLDDRVGEELLAHVLEALFTVFPWGGIDLKLDVLADARILHLFETEARERASDGLTLRIEDASFQSHIDLGQHYLSPRLRRMRASGSSVSGTKARPVTCS